MSEAKRRFWSGFTRSVLNPVMRRVAGRIPGWVLLETRGRRTGRPHQTPVGASVQDHTLWLVAEHGRRADYVRNIEATPRVRVLVRSRWREGTAHVLEDDDARARLRSLPNKINNLALLAVATEPLTVRIDLDP